MIAPVVFVCTLLGLVLASPGKLPDEMPRCKRTDPKLSDCLTKAVQASIPTLVKGIPKLGLFSIDPLDITLLSINEGASKGPVALDLIFHNLKISGLRDVVIRNVTTDLDHFKIDIEVFLPTKLHLDGDYEMKGNVLILPLQGKGKTALSLDNLSATIFLSGKENKKNGLKHMELESLLLSYNTTLLTMNFENLFSQDKTVGDNLNIFLNENWQEIHKEIQPAFEEALGIAFKAVASRIMNKVPFDEIFLP